jgi:hypothetical protein
MWMAGEVFRFSEDYLVWGKSERLDEGQRLQDRNPIQHWFASQGPSPRFGSCRADFVPVV